MLEVHLLTLFPEAVEGYLQASILGRAQAAGKLQVHTLDFRRFATDKHRTVDDRPFGGGPGMVLKPGPIFEAVEWVETEFGPCHRILLTPDGARYTQADAAQLATHERILLLCSRYEGFDERVRQGMEWQEISIGDFVLSGGEIPALAVIEAAARLIPGVVGDAESIVHESFGAQGILDFPHYTRPAEFRGMSVPPVLLSGNHSEVAKWRQQQATERTQSRRPDLTNT